MDGSIKANIEIAKNFINEFEKEELNIDLELAIKFLNRAINLSKK